MTKQKSLKITGTIFGLIAYAGLAAAVLTGCNTVEGAGKDVQKGGERNLNAPLNVTSSPGQ